MDTNAQLKAAYSWLRERAEELIQASSYVRPQDGRLMEFVSVMGQGRYQGMWTRDYAYRVIALPERYASDTGAGSLSLLLEQFSADFVPPELVGPMGG